MLKVTKMVAFYGTLVTLSTVLSLTKGTHFWSASTAPVILGSHILEQPGGLAVVDRLREAAAALGLVGVIGINADLRRFLTGVHNFSPLSTGRRFNARRSLPFLIQVKMKQL